MFRFRPWKMILSTPTHSLMGDANAIQSPGLEIGTLTKEQNEVVRETGPCKG